jgi:hypothetical protein
MTWVRLDDDFPSHRKIRKLTDAAFRLHVAGLCWSSKYLTNGWIPNDDLYLVVDIDEHLDPVRYREAVEGLVRQGVWHTARHDCPTCPTSADGWIIHDYLDLNPSADDVRKQRLAAAERQRRSRERRRPESTDADAEEADVSRVSHAAPHPHPHPHPHPSTGSVSSSLRSEETPPAAAAATSREATARRIVREATDASDAEAAVVVAKIRVERQPRSLPGLLRTMAAAGDLRLAVDDLRADGKRAQFEEDMRRARDGPPCIHQQPGGANPHPITGEALCPQCRRVGWNSQTAVFRAVAVVPRTAPP